MDPVSPGSPLKTSSPLFCSSPLFSFSSFSFFHHSNSLLYPIFLPLSLHPSPLYDNKSNSVPLFLFGYYKSILEHSITYKEKNKHPLYKQTAFVFVSFSDFSFFFLPFMFSFCLIPKIKCTSCFSAQAYFTFQAQEVLKSKSKMKKGK